MTLENLILETPYLMLDDECYDITDPTPLEAPYLINFNPEAAALIDLDPNSDADPRLIDFFNGTYLPKGAHPFAMCYAGHQFGHFVPRLGDGRAINLGRVKGWNLQLKGSGETLYSRMGDGRAVLRSSIREYLMGEALHYLGIPTTRALGIIGSETTVLRNRIEQGAIVMRMSPSWVRFGTFEYFYYTGEYAKLESLAEYVIAESYPHLQGDEDRFYKLFCEIVTGTATLIAQWQGVGFNHGVMNTDNMSIAGLTIDYGPYAMLDDFDFGFVCNTTDRAGRYSYGQQPNVAYWNLTMLSRALTPIISQERMQEVLDTFGQQGYPDAYMKVMRNKLGCFIPHDKDTELIEQLVSTLQDAQVDYTLFFRTLSRYDGERSPLFDIAMNPIVIDQWLHHYDARLEQETIPQEERHLRMLRTNPKYILKNYLLQEAITRAEHGDTSMVETLRYIATHPYEELPKYEQFAQETPEVHKNLRLSCSS